MTLETALGTAIAHDRGEHWPEGPQFSTKAESEPSVLELRCRRHDKHAGSEIGREAEMCYATVAMVTDYDCWHPDHEHVTVEKVIAMVGENAAKARSLIKTVAPLLSGREDICHAGCHRALDGALITAHAARDPKVLSRLDAVAMRVLNSPCAL